ETEHTRALEQHAISRLELLAQSRKRLVRVRDIAAAVGARALADGDQDLDADLLDGLRDLEMRLVRVASELSHLTQDGDPAATRRKQPQVHERSTHRDGIRVPRVVDEHSAAGKGELLVPPLREGDVEVLR